MLEEWAYVKLYTSEAERREAFGVFLHLYNHHRSHSALEANPRSAESTTCLVITPRQQRSLPARPPGGPGQA
jgi:transposase InsO family protein